MTQVVVPVPMSKSLRDAAAKAAEDYGIPSLADALRVLAAKLSRKEVNMEVEEEIHLSPQAKKRYANMEEDFKKGKNVKSFTNIEDLMADLRS